MKFEQAIKYAKQGKKIKRNCKDCVYYYEIDKFYVKKNNVKYVNALVSIDDVLADDWEIVEEKKKYWEPQLDETYYYMSIHKGSANAIKNVGDCIDSFNFSVGNCFKTQEEANHMIKKLNIIHELQKFAYENNEGEIDWNDNSLKYYMIYNKDSDDILLDLTFQIKHSPFTIHFTSKEAAFKAIKKFGKDIIKKYYFDVEE